MRVRIRLEIKDVSIARPISRFTRKLFDRLRNRPPVCQQCRNLIVPLGCEQLLQPSPHSSVSRCFYTTRPSEFF